MGLAPPLLLARRPWWRGWKGLFGATVSTLICAEKKTGARQFVTSQSGMTARAACAFAAARKRKASDDLLQ